MFARSRSASAAISSCKDLRRGNFPTRHIAPTLPARAPFNKSQVGADLLSQTSADTYRQSARDLLCHRDLTLLKQSASPNRPKTHTPHFEPRAGGPLDTLSGDDPAKERPQLDSRMKSRYRYVRRPKRVIRCL